MYKHGKVVIKILQGSVVNTNCVKRANYVTMCSPVANFIYCIMYRSIMKIDEVNATINRLTFLAHPVGLPRDETLGATTQ